MARKGWHAVQLYQIKVTLLGTRPPIWRRLIVRDDFDLIDLHHILQIAFSWQDSHLHQWLIPNDGKLTARSMRRENSRLLAERRFGMGEWSEPSDDVGLNDVLATPKASILYEYDMGDSWEHEIKLEKVLPWDRTTVATCTGGKLAAPPDDCGGVGGYYVMLEVLADPDHPEHDDRLEWLGVEAWDENAFDVDAINGRLRKSFK